MSVLNGQISHATDHERGDGALACRVAKVMLQSESFIHKGDAYKSHIDLYKMADQMHDEKIHDAVYGIVRHRIRQATERLMRTAAVPCEVIRPIIADLYSAYQATINDQQSTIDKR